MRPVFFTILVGENFNITPIYMFNVALAHSNFTKCPESALKWSHRGPLLLHEILRAGPDIVCLEEVDHYHDLFRPELSKHGYESTFFPKYDSPCLNFPNNSGPDGCALFYLSARFELIRKKDVILRNAEGGESHQVAILAELKIKDEDEIKQQQQSELDKKEKKNEVVKKQELPIPSSIFVCVTHLKAKPEGKDMRTAQGKHLIEEMNSFSQAGSPIIIAGDFNATSAEEVYGYFSNPDAHPSLKMASSYKCAHYGGNEPEFTSWKFRDKEYKYTIDYIWYNTESLCVENVWDLPATEMISEAGLPCKNYPSDHVALCTEFSII